MNFFLTKQNKLFYQASFHLQLGTLGAGNHYAEIQVVDEIFNEYAAKKMGIDHKGQVCVMIHSGSRGLGHQVATGTVCRPCRNVRLMGNWMEGSPRTLCNCTARGCRFYF